MRLHTLLRSTNEAAIKLRGFTGNDDAVADFLEELGEYTKPHPYNHKLVLRGSIGIDVSRWEDGIHLGDIVSLGDKGAGHGTEALQLLTHLADKHGVPITGLAKAYSNVDGHIQDTHQLAQWYQKHGFEISGEDEDYGFDIEYHPNSGQYA